MPRQQGVPLLQQIVHAPILTAKLSFPAMAEPPMSPNLSLGTQVWRFLVTGGLAAIVDFGLYLLFLELDWHVNLAKTLSFIAGTTTAYLINRRWTFQAAPSRARFFAVMALYALTYIVQVGINYLFYTTWDDKPWRVPVAFVIAQGTATVINFVVQRAVIFRLR
ncbi:GtrA family protein [soil metagenome]